VDGPACLFEDCRLVMAGHIDERDIGTVKEVIAKPQFLRSGREVR